MADWKGGAGGLATGATTGATLGSIIPGVGTAIGGGVGGLLGGLAGLFGIGNKKKKGAKKSKLSTFDKRQQELNKKQHQGVLGEGPLADLYNYNPQEANAVFDQIAARPAQRNFQEKTIPGITGAFRSQGLQNSSYAGDALSKAGRDVQENLDALRSQYLYNEQQGARTAKRGAVENLQNRQTFGYDVGQKGFDISNVLNSITPDTANQFKSYFNRTTNQTGLNNASTPGS